MRCIAAGGSEEERESEEVVFFFAARDTMLYLVVAVAAVLAAVSECMATELRDYAGHFARLPSYTGPRADLFPGGWAKLELIIEGDGNGRGDLDDDGVRALSQVVLYGDSSMQGMTFAAHVHAESCDTMDGGDIYQNPNNPNPQADAIDEISPTLRCNSNELVSCRGAAVTTWIPTADALGSGLSLVVLDTPNGGERWLCADLVKIERFLWGEFGVLPSFGDDSYGF